MPAVSDNVDVRFIVGDLDLLPEPMFFQQAFDSCVCSAWIHLFVQRTTKDHPAATGD
jgi:hypothetical protein